MLLAWYNNHVFHKFIVVSTKSILIMHLYKINDSQRIIEKKKEEGRNMIDIHCHILPGIDDGAQSIEDAIEMAKQAVSQGITTIIATPHPIPG